MRKTAAARVKKNTQENSQDPRRDDSSVSNVHLPSIEAQTSPPVQRRSNSEPVRRSPAESHHHSNTRTNRRTANEPISQYKKKILSHLSNTKKQLQPSDKKSGSRLNQKNNNLQKDKNSSLKSTITPRVQRTGKHAVSTLKLMDSILSALSDPDSNHMNWIVQVSPETLNIWQNEFLAQRNIKCRVKTLGRDFYFLALERDTSSQELLNTIFPRWICPIQLQWPVSPHSDQFVEKAARGIIKRFGQSWTSLQVLSSTPELKNIATGLKGRLIQLQSNTIGGKKSPNENFPLSTPGSPPQVPDRTTKEFEEDTKSNCVAVLVHPQGILAGERSTLLGFGTVFPGGLGFLHSAGMEGIHTKKFPKDESELNRLPQKSSLQLPISRPTEAPAAPIQHLHSNTTRISRAGGKISEVMLLLSSCLNITSDVYHHWLELGAAPGGMTEELVNWGAKVTAVDLANLARHIEVHPNVTYLKEHAQNISSAKEFEGILCDMNGPAENSANIMCKLIPTLNPGSLIVHTLKLRDLRTALEQIHSMKTKFQNCGCQILFIKHLFHNRKEVTFVMIRSASAGNSSKTRRRV